ncbi:MAG: alpha/beta hydrolase fold domain-containing protein [Rhodospirillaceae bacterium]|jgi:dienelactone hydrolase|nr:alpha/beta hydrolase fold domain-containing protein [Rhodospirillaceae bacterium]
MREHSRHNRTCALVLLVALSTLLVLAPVSAADAEGIKFKSASPYQLADWLAEPTPTYDVEIDADLIYPDEIKAAMPAFVFMHGSGGRLLRHHRYLELARKPGFVTLQIDSFGPRGIGSTVGNQTNVTAAMMTTDLLRAMKLLAERPGIDPKKIVVMGSSKGAIAALYAAWTPIREKVAGDLDFAGYALLYPLCATIEDAQITAAPVHVFIGEEDNWTPAAPCIEQVKRMKALGQDWAISLYEGAYHGFDAPIKGIRAMPSAYSMASCNIALRADGYEYETGSGYLLTKAERRSAFRFCAKKGSVKMGGYHAADALLKDVETFLRSVVD